MFLIQDQISTVRARGIIVDDEERPADSSSIGENFELTIADVSNETDFVRDQVSPP